MVAKQTIGQRQRYIQFCFLIAIIIVVNELRYT
jgi:hypothetical protein